MSDKQKFISPIWLQSLLLLFSATTCYVNPIRYTREAVHLKAESEAIFAVNDSLNTDIDLVIWPKYIKPKKEVIISIFLEYGVTRQFVLRDTTRYHPDMSMMKTTKRISINAPLEVRLSPGHGILTYSLRYRNPKTGAYREIFEPFNWPELSSEPRPVIAMVFADSVSYLSQKNMKPLQP